MPQGSGGKAAETGSDAEALKACLNNLIGVLALPALWLDREEEHVIRTLIDAVSRTLQLDFVYARLNLPDGRVLENIGIARSGGAIEEGDTRQAIRQWLRNEPPSRPASLRGLHSDDFQLTALPLGSDEHTGVVVAGSNRPGFPAESERLILSVAANQATIALREARLRDGQQKLARELDFAPEQRDEAIRSELAALAANYARLTRREREVLPYVVAGRLSKQIAAELGTSEITIRVHRGQIMRKMGAQSLAQLIRMTDRLGVH